jgi:glycosyltransferase involved in cell wall biosynthesis
VTGEAPRQTGEDTRLAPRRLRIAFLTPEFVTEPYFCGGLANHLHRTGAALARRGHQAIVLVPSRELPSRLELDGIEVRRAAPGPALAWLARRAPRRLGGSAEAIAQSLALARELARLHRERPVDLAQAASSRACGLAARVLVPVPQLLRASCYRPQLNQLAGIPRGLDARLVEALEALALRLARQVVTPSRTLRGVLERQAGRRGVRVLPPPFALETAERDPAVLERVAPAGPYLVFFGRLQLHKGFHVLIEALPAFLAAHPEARLVCAGPDHPTRLAPSMRDWARARLGDLAERVVFTGALRHAQLYPLVAGARLAVLPSLLENLPNACLEAMALGTPVVGTRGASFDEILEDGVSGFLVEPGDAAALARGLAAAWAHPRLKQIGLAAERAVARFGEAEGVVALLACYGEVLAEGRRAGVCS